MRSPIARLLLALFLVSLLVRAATAATLQHAGYFDAFYYYHIALNMAEGRGMTESVIWNYLDDPTTLPRPSNQYWMPLTNLLGWLSIVLGRGVLGPWRAAQVPFVLGSALLPPLAAGLAWLGWGRRDWALAAGLLTLFSGVYFAQWVVTDNFTPFALTIALGLLALGRAEETGQTRWWAVAGLGAGLSHLARVDGALLVPVIAALLAWDRLRGPGRDPARFLREGAAAALGYLVIMGPWWLRNTLAVGTPFPGGGTQTLWLRGYNEIFAYDLALTAERYVAWGVGPILRSKVSSLGVSLLIVAGAALFFLLPFILLAVRDAARRPLFRPFLLYAVVMLTAMPLIFTFPATRGSLLHSTAALVPWGMALVPTGIARAVHWIAARRRTWDEALATRVLSGGFLTLAAFLTLYLYAMAVWLPPQPGAVVARWNDRTVPYDQVEDWFAAQGVSPSARLFVGDPPAYTMTTGRPTLIIPTDGPATLVRAARAWDAPWLLLDRDNRDAYRAMYDQRQAEAGWQPVATFTDALGHPVHLFRLEGSE